MRAVLIGSGNTAWHLAPVLQQAGVDWVQVYSPTEAHAGQMAARLGNISYTAHLEKIHAGADFYLIAVKDEAVAELASRLRLPGKTVVHVSGSVSMEILKPVSPDVGVFYCFQTFSKNAPCPDLKHTPVCLEASNAATMAVLRDTAEKISDTVCEMNSEQRTALHLSGVLACNYANFMYKAAFEVLRSHNIDFKLLLPLIRQTADKQNGEDPFRFQTGPAVREDEAVLEKHATLLGSHPNTHRYLEMYNLLADAVRDEKQR